MADQILAAEERLDFTELIGYIFGWLVNLYIMFALFFQYMNCEFDHDSISSPCD
jgi:hypothetical protein